MRVCQFHHSGEGGHILPQSPAPCQFFSAGSGRKKERSRTLSGPAPEARGGGDQAQVMAVGFSKMTDCFRKVTAFVRPSQLDMRLSSCSMLMAPS